MVDFLQILDYKLYKYWERHLHFNYLKYRRGIIKIAKVYMTVAKVQTHHIRNHKKKKVIVSITSVPDRMDTLYWTLKSILRQTIKPDCIILYLAKDEFPNEKVIPFKIKKMKKRGLEIKYVDNLKSHKKYYYTMQKYPYDITITIDDDIIYSEKLIQNLLNKYEKYPESVICARGNVINRINGKAMKYTSWKGIEEYDSPENIDTKDIFFTTGGGTLFPNWLMTKETLNHKKFMILTQTADDVWLNYMVRLSNIEVHTTDSLDFHCIFNCENQGSALADFNLCNGGNDMSIENMEKEYKITL